MNISDVIPSLEKFIPALMHEADVPGVAITLIEATIIIWEHGFGVKSKESPDPVENDTVFEAASLSKPIFAYSALQLCENGVLQLDTPLSKYFPLPYTEDGFDPNDALLKLVTLRQVLSHSAGFGNWGKKEVGKINFTPGEKFFYAGEGYLYLQRVIEYLMKCSLDKFMGLQVLRPLEMHSSSYIWNERFEHRIAQGHGKRNEGVGSRWTEPIAAYSLYTTAHDVARFLTNMMRSGKGDAYHLSATMLDEMLSPQIRVNETLSWGLGWGIEKTSQGEFFWQWGHIGDYTCFALASRVTQNGLVIMTNSKNGLHIFKQIVQMVIGGVHPCFKFFIRPSRIKTALSILNRKNPL